MRPTEQFALMKPYPAANGVECQSNAMEANALASPEYVVALSIVSKVRRISTESCELSKSCWCSKLRVTMRNERDETES